MGLQILLSLLGGISLLMLIPFLYIVGLQETQHQSEIMAMVAQAVQALGLELNLVTGLFAFLLLILLQGAARYYQSVLSKEIVERFAQHLRERIYKAMAYASWLCIVRMQATDIHHTLHSDIGRITNAVREQQIILGTLLLTAANIFIALYLSVSATLLALACGGILLVIIKPLNVQVRASGEEMHGIWKQIYAAITDHLDGLKIAKSYGLEEASIQRFSLLGSHAVKEAVGLSRITAKGQVFQQIGVAVALCGFIYIGVDVIALPVAELILLILLFSRLLPNFSRLLSSWQKIQHEMPSLEAYQVLYSRLKAAREPVSAPADSPVVFERAVRLEDISFRYNPDAEPALKHISLKIPARSMTAIVGPSGAGKSTLADILIGLLTPSERHLFIDDTPLSGAFVHAWRHAVGYVPQETFLFHDTIRANVRWGRPEATDEALWQALQLAAADTFVGRLPEGLDTIVGDRGIRLSGGERQRIALARALIRKPSLLLLDEATSALDTEHERRIQEAIDRLHGELTLVVIAHRLSTICKADHIVVLNRGHVVEEGTWEALMARPQGFFKGMVERDA